MKCSVILQRTHNSRMADGCHPAVCSQLIGTYTFLGQRVLWTRDKASGALMAP